MITGLRRSSLYVPGDSEKMLRKSTGVTADMLLLNLEDGVSGGKKDEARDSVARALREQDFGPREVVVRVNSLSSDTGKKDLAAIVPCRPDGICFPKVESAAAIHAADAAVLEIELACGLEEGATRFHAMIESARGVLEAPEIASASSRMAALIFGSADYVEDVRCRPGEHREELLLAMQQIVLAARAAGMGGGASGFAGADRAAGFGGRVLQIRGDGLFLLFEPAAESAPVDASPLKVRRGGADLDAELVFADARLIAVRVGDSSALDRFVSGGIAC